MGRGWRISWCQLAADDFERRAGRALFLATENPSARRLYEALGWVRVAGSYAMVRLCGGLSPDQFFFDHFGDDSELPVSVVYGGPQFRITMIPLILAAHDWMILDHNAAIISTRYAVQPSCEGLYGRYESLDVKASSAWFAAVCSDGVVVGLASAKRVARKEFCVEAFTHASYQREWLKPLYEQAIHWVRQRDCKVIYTTCARGDHLKEAALREHLGDKFCDIKYVDLWS